MSSRRPRLSCPANWRQGEKTIQYTG
ncbi:MAG: hypothetical protein ACLFU6_11785 [Candidatus Hydrogenedentota bacterium]